MKATNILDIGSTHIVKPHAIGYQQQFGLWPKLENFACGLSRSMIIAFHSKKIITCLNSIII
jgi:hypothetical protein